ncbi:DODA-type extradiol aromatic ring-opening family dioxygenase [Limobrevibacterium gyesilva]|uniref:Dioxygenase n=1 Tax=Limobrevibacterium gyesilva TaxID=2991712 RepID=A0AA41YHQ3_9PROT|nr:class III extradiol ring-cleavage dioxygenase [Limobrevibacterium gyesilva]MCW3472974.1 dioxygenase [Limobrevibacterium gyesilva]
MLPSLFISHGSPMLPLVETPARDFLAGLGGTLPRPKAILVASAHWETERPTVNAVARNDTIHDFFGFPRALYELSYPAPGDPALAERVSDLLGAAGLASEVDRSRGLDHGAWVPLLLAYPDADIPVLQVSVQSHLGPAHHLQLGQALAPLRAEGVLVIGSGSFTHDLRRFRGQGIDTPEAPDVVAFSDWMDEALAEGRRSDLLTYRNKAPHAADEHPTEEHLLPLFVAMGAGGEGATPRRIHKSANYGVLRMDAYAFA